MAKQYRVQRKVATMPVTAGGFDMRDLPRAYDYEALFLRLSGTLNVTGACTSVRAEAPTQLVTRVEVIAEGKNTIYSAPFWACSLGRYNRPLNQAGARVTTPPTAAGIAAYAVEAIGVIDFATIDGVRPKDSNFRTSGLSLFQLRASFGNPIDPFVPGAGAVSFTGVPTLEIFTAEVVEGPDAQGKVTTPIALKKTTWMRAPMAASNNNFEQRLPAGNQLKSVVIRAEGNTTAGEPSAAQLNNVMLSAGLDVRLNLTGAQLRAKNNADYGSLTAGYYVADVCSRGQSAVALADLWNLRGQVEPKITLDAVGGANNFFDFIVTEYILAQAA